jgi:hypothetical protein
MFQAEGELFHRLNQLWNSKTYCIKFGQKHYCYTKLQLFFLSLNVCDYFETCVDDFVIEDHLQNNSFVQDLITCFEQLNSLFHSTIEIVLTNQNVSSFQILEDILGNPFLKLKCLEVTSTQNQVFKLTSKYLTFFIRKQIDELIDFSLIVKD